MFGAISYLLSIVTMALSCIILEIKRDIGQKSWFFHTPLYLASRLGGSPSEYCYVVWHRKTRMAWLPDGEKKFDDVYSFCHNSRTWQTDRHTDIAWRQRPLLMLASRGKNGGFQCTVRTNMMLDWDVDFICVLKKKITDNTGIFTLSRLLSQSTILPCWRLLDMLRSLIELQISSH